jgi:hypothetical protein
LPTDFYKLAELVYGSREETTAGEEIKIERGHPPNSSSHFIPLQL